LSISSISIEEMSTNVFRVVAEVANAGFLPTSSTAKGKELLLEGIHARIDGELEVVGGTSPVSIGHLDGYGSQSTWAPANGQRAYAEWIVRANRGTNATIAFEDHRAGRIAQTVVLGGELG
jgi:hypothetical protein